MRKHAALALLLALALPGREAAAAEVTELTSAFDDDDPFDAHVTVGYGYTLHRGAIKRESLGDVYKELRFSQVRHVLKLRTEFGIYKDLQFHVELPIVLRDSRSFGFALNGGDPCEEPGPDGKRTDNCVTRANSTLVRDGFLDGSRMSDTQVDVANHDRPPGGLGLPYRSGLDQLNFGVSWAPFSQARDATKPTWVVGFEARIAVGPPMRYNPADDPNTSADDPAEAQRTNSAVGRGIHQLHWWMTVSRRLGKYVDPWFTVFYMLPVAAQNSLFHETDFPGSGQERAGPQHQGGFELGLEIIPWEVPEKKHRFSIELRMGMTGFFEGRGYSPAWELLANSPRLSGGCLKDPNSTSNTLLWDNGHYCRNENESIPYPGITNIENYLRFAGSMVFNIRFTEYFHGRLGLALAHDTAHAITLGDAGRAAQPNGRIDLDDPRQVNPLYRPIIDAANRRLRVEETTVFDVFFHLTGMF